MGMGLTDEQKEQLAYNFNNYTKNLYCLMVSCWPAIDSCLPSPTSQTLVLRVA